MFTTNGALPSQIMIYLCAVCGSRFFNGKNSNIHHRTHKKKLPLRGLTRFGSTLFHSLLRRMESACKKNVGCAASSHLIRSRRIYGSLDMFLGDVTDTAAIWEQSVGAICMRNASMHKTRLMQFCKVLGL